MSESEEFSVPEGEDGVIDHDLPVDDLEAAYLSALASLEHAEATVDLTWRELASESPSVTPEEPLGENIGQPAETEEPSPPVAEPEPIAEAQTAVAEPEAESVTETEVIEAMLFVGGRSLTAKGMASVLGENWTSSRVEEAIAVLNDRYASQRRPYHVSLGEGGYAFQLHSEFEPLRHQLYGLGPKEIRLNREAVEVLSLVAYRQPITRERLNEIREKPTSGPLRQLLRRELLVLDRELDEPAYRTSPRFLSLFGIQELSELPEPDDLTWK